MLIIVKERTREIGVRRALGAPPKHIAGQLPNERLDDWHDGYHAGVQRSIDCLKHFGVE